MAVFTPRVDGGRDLETNRAFQRLLAGTSMKLRRVEIPVHPRRFSAGVSS